MPSQTPFRGVGFLTVLIVATACDEMPTHRAPGPAVFDRAGAAGPIMDMDDEFENIARHEVPGFAGYHLDRDGTPVISLVDLSARANAARVLQQRFAALGQAPAGSRARRVEYDFAALREWQGKLAQVAFPNLAFATDVDEVENRVWFGVETHAAVGQIRAAAARLGIPANAVFVEVQQRPTRRKLLTDNQRPTQGGYRIQTKHDWFGQNCTIGFNAIFNGTQVFVTNSHCSSTLHGLDATTAYQSWVNSGLEIGFEWQDPGTHGCTMWSKCAWADAALYAYYPGVTVDQGYIGRTMDWRGNTAATLEVDPAAPTFQIVGKQTTSVPSGTWIDKVGSRTGWTQGWISRSCVYLMDLGVLYRCQNEAWLYSDKGDSGSPVLLSQSTGMLHGILWGGPLDDPSTSWYSPISGLESHFGGLLTVTAPAPPPPPPPPGGECPECEIIH